MQSHENYFAGDGQNERLSAGRVEESYCRMLSPSPLSPQLQEVHDRALEAARIQRRNEGELIRALMEVERERIFVKLGFPSLFSYAVQALDLSEPVAYSAISVARKSLEIPEFAESIESGAVTLSKARKIASILTPENQGEWLMRAATLTSRELEKSVAEADPRPASPDTVRYLSGNLIELSVTVSEQTMLQLRRAQEVLCQKKGEPVSLGETIKEMVEAYLERHDPQRRAARGVARAEAAPNPTAAVKTLFPGTVGARTAIPLAIAHRVRLRDGGRCQFPRMGGGICGSQRWVDFHHIKPVHQGGDHSTENLVLLCRTHHREIHGPLGGGFGPPGALST